MATEVLERPTADLEIGQGERRYAHYVDKDKIVDSVVGGSAMTALCGYTWVPSRDPKNYPVCPECQRLFDLGPEGRMRELEARRESGS